MHGRSFRCFPLISCCHSPENRFIFVCMTAFLVKEVLVCHDKGKLLNMTGIYHRVNTVCSTIKKKGSFCCGDSIIMLMQGEARGGKVRMILRAWY